MQVTQAIFLSSNTDYDKCPLPNKPEYAFIGRSNVGKSSLINSITGNGKLAKVSAKPGKTRLLNHFLINDNWYLVDLPGYGWAKASKTEKEKWNKMVRDYFNHRENLQCVFVLVDSRIEPQQIDLDFMKWLGQTGIPFCIVFTKCDKQTKNKVNQSVTLFQTEFLKDWEEMPTFFVTSSVTNVGKDEILNYIAEINHNFKNN